MHGFPFHHGVKLEKGLDRAANDGAVGRSAEDGVSKQNPAMDCRADRRHANVQGFSLRTGFNSVLLSRT